MKQLLLLTLIIINGYLTHANSTPYQFKDIGIENKINSVITQNIILTDEFDNQINLLDAINNKPTIINFVYLNCPLLCHLLLDGIVDVANRSHYKIGKDYQIISISIDPQETNETLAEYKKKYLKTINNLNGWTFLKGTEKEIQKVTKALGYHYKFIERTNDYAHPSVLYFYNKKLTNYIEGVTFEKNAYDYSIIATKSITTLKEKVITYCYYFDPDNQTYSFYIFKVLRLACLLTVIILSIMIVNLLLKERKQNKYEH